MAGGFLLDCGRGKINPKPLCPMPTFSETGMPGKSECSSIPGPAWREVRVWGHGCLLDRFPGPGPLRRQVCRHLGSLHCCRAGCSCSGLAWPDRVTRCQSSRGTKDLMLPGEQGSRTGASGPSALHGLTGTSRGTSKTTWMTPYREPEPNPRKDPERDSTWLCSSRCLGGQAKKPAVIEDGWELGAGGGAIGEGSLEDGGPTGRSRRSLLVKMVGKGIASNGKGMEYQQWALG